MHTALTRRTTLLGLGAAALLPDPAHADLTEFTASARKEGSLTWYVAQMSGEAAEDMGRIFTGQHPGISVSVVRTTGQVAYQRVQQELKNNAPKCDVFSTTDIAHMPALHVRGALANYVPQNAAQLAAPFVGLGQAGYYYATTASLQVMVYQTNAIPPTEVPRNWPDLIDPKWKNHVAVAHLAFSGYFGSGCWQCASCTAGSTLRSWHRTSHASAVPETIR
jgi:iron(III) transport system substrate-binding protein